MTQISMQSTIDNIQKLSDKNYNIVAVIVRDLLAGQEDENLSVDEALAMTKKNMKQYDAVFKELAK
ncbi:MAG: hypothetical protein SPL94_01600 [Oribacterium sp.]|nr:hypothetical protein [Oribacterium sp.]MDY6309522.1 hypothetical protein [Oribacterium sp.]